MKVEGKLKERIELVNREAFWVEENGRQGKIYLMDWEQPHFESGWEPLRAAERAVRVALSLRESSVAEFPVAGRRAGQDHPQVAPVAFTQPVRSQQGLQASTLLHAHYPALPNCSIVPNKKTSMTSLLTHTWRCACSHLFWLLIKLQLFLLSSTVAVNESLALSVLNGYTSSCYNCCDKNEVVTRF